MNPIQLKRCDPNCRHRIWVTYDKVPLRLCEMPDNHLKNAEQFMGERINDLELRRKLNSDANWEHQIPDSRWDAVLAQNKRMQKALEKELRRRGLAPYETTRPEREQP